MEGDFGSDGDSVCSIDYYMEMAAEKITTIFGCFDNSHIHEDVDRKYRNQSRWRVKLA